MITFTKPSASGSFGGVIRACFVSALVALGFVFSGHAAHAATLYFSPSSGSYAVGKTFTVNVMVSTPDQDANAYSGNITFPSDLLEATALGKGGSVVSLWVQEPSFSAGHANFEGVTFNPGYKGGAGKMISLTFKVKAAGSAVVRFSSGSVLANDGQGTNILTGLGSATFNLTGAGGETTPPPPAEVTGKPAAPKISSTTHPDSAKWYAQSDATFKWGLQTGVDAVNILADQSPSSDPGTSSDGLFSSYTYQDVKDGIWYFHLRVRNKNGWSGASHYQFQIDTIKPDHFRITETGTSDLSQPTKTFGFDAADSGSGIDHYEIQIDVGAVDIWKDDGGHVYRTQPVGPGAHVLTARAVDKAGNFLEETAKFTVQALAPPHITEYPRAPNSGDTLVVKGVTYPNASVTVWVRHQEDRPYSQQVTSDEQGKFTFVDEEKLKKGDYEVWATVSDSLGNSSEPSEKVLITVKAPPFDVIGWILGLIASVNLLAMLLMLLLLLLAYLLWRYMTLKKKLGKDIHGAQEALHKAFDLLKDDIQQQVKMLEKVKTKRELTLEEGKILKKLKQDLKVAETYIRKRIDAIEKRM